jgi:hypothetical protein
LDFRQNFGGFGGGDGVFHDAGGKSSNCDRGLQGVSPFRDHTLKVQHGLSGRISSTGATGELDGWSGHGWKRQNFHGPETGHGNVRNAQNLGKRLVLRRATRWWVRWELFRVRRGRIDLRQQDGGRGLTYLLSFKSLQCFVNLLINIFLINLLIKISNKKQKKHAQQSKFITEYIYVFSCMKIFNPISIVVNVD